MARTMGTWLSGPSSEPASGYPGERLGLPQQGPGSIARFGRRVGAILADWLISLGLTALCALVFVFGLRMNVPLIGPWLGF